MDLPSYVQFVLVPQMLSGLMLGIAVALVALGLTIVFGLLDVVNMAHGEFYAAGAYLAVALAAAGIGFWPALLFVPLLLVPAGYALERLLINPVYETGRDRHVTTLLVTFGLAMIIEDGILVIFGTQTLRPPPPISGSIELFGMVLPQYRLFLIIFGAVVIGTIMLIIYQTPLGTVVRAAAFDGKMAASLGIPVKRVYAATFAIGVALAGFAGVLLAPVYAAFPTMGQDFIFLAFAAVIVGGLGSVVGATAAGLLLTQVQALASLVMSPVWAEPTMFAVAVTVLVLRPQGMFGRLGHG